MNNSWACDDCVHKEVCAHRSTLIALQNELYDSLGYMRFRGIEHVAGFTRKLDSYGFIKTVKIECEHYLRGTSISES